MKNSNKLHWSMLLFWAGIVLYILVNFQRAAVPGTIFNELQTYFNATATEITQIGAAFMWVYAVVQLFVGLLVDRYSGARVMAAGGVLIAAGSVLFPFSRSLFNVYCCRVLVGIGCGTVFLSMVKEIDRLFPRKFPFYMGLMYIFGFSGTILGTLPLAWAVKSAGWRIPFMAVGGVAVVGALTYLVTLKKVHLPQIRREKMIFSPIFTPLFRAHTRNLFLSCGLNTASYYVMISFVGKKILEDCAGFSTYVAGVCLMAMAVTSAVTSYFAGILCTRWTNRRCPVYQGFLITGVISSFLGLLAISLAWKNVILYFVIMILVAAAASIGGIVSTLIRELTPPQEMGAAAGTNNGTIFVVTAIVAAIAGILMDKIGASEIIRTETSVIYPRSSYIALYGLILFNSLLAFWLSTKIPETFGHNISAKFTEQNPKAK